jgi:hypothetical protein
MLWVKTFATITNLLLVLSESNSQAIHYKHHSWSTGTTGDFFFFSLRSSFTVSRRTIYRFTTSIHGFTISIHGSTTYIVIQHFEQICRVSMLPMEVPQPLQQPMLLYKPLASFVSLYTHPTSKRCCDLYTTFQRLFHNAFERSLQDFKWVFHGITFLFLIGEISSIESQHVFDPRRSCIPPSSMIFFYLLKKLQKELQIWIERSLQYLK